MNTAFELPSSRHPEKLISKACPLTQPWRGYPFADISILALRHRAKVLAIPAKACFDRGLPSGKRPAKRR
ncbi:MULTISPECIES: hypothetical protein [unclassified Rhizobium]|uniref:hypothetical protein n=1 Tax=unclassified Rhizobium TaxID=2613769 RepID=UPI001C83A844|nr:MULTISPECIES: hypothetical protein [unclassified Rhizobium]MBX5157441.1 hypothetical protein [Rhizobium sp. NZLR8]MBX5163173.1 hypothetical protein [Rhizobium sp. NZLR4b]MBX5183908.1 hypothetical protein [Rhizobium sp. NZLR5]MBX5207592.1 hypothetical protein [Rhizobium sp. NZLR11]